MQIARYCPAAVLFQPNLTSRRTAPARRLVVSPQQANLGWYLLHPPLYIAYLTSDDALPSLFSPGGPLYLLCLAVVTQ